MPGKNCMRLSHSPKGKAGLGSLEKFMDHPGASRQADRRSEINTGKMVIKERVLSNHRA